MLLLDATADASADASAECRLPAISIHTATFFAIAGQEHDRRIENIFLSLKNNLVFFFLKKKKESAVLLLYHFDAVLFRCCIISMLY